MGMRARYITAASYDEALARSGEALGIPQDEIFAETVREGSEEEPMWTVLAMPKSASQNSDGGFNLLYETDGVYLEVYPPRGAGTAQSPDAVSQYLQRKEISNMSAIEALGLLKKGRGRARIAPSQREFVLKESLAVTITKGDMRAEARLMPPDGDGEKLTLETAIASLKSSGVVWGIDEETLADILERRDYGTGFVVARGREVRDGENGELEFHFRQELTGAPKDIGGGRVDIRTLDLFETVQEGQPLVTRRPPTFGEAGMTVRGVEIAPKPGRDAKMPRCKNAAVNEDGTVMTASCGGMVTFTSNVVTVTSVYEVNGDCDMGVGNIDFNGSVNIKGNVISGIKIRAAGNIVIGGVVEASELTAGGSIELKRGMQGMDRGTLTAAGDIVAQFIERTSVSCEGTVMADVIIHSRVDAGRSVLMDGKHSSILGGMIRVTEQVRARTVGSASQVQTNIEVSLHPKKLERMKALQGEQVKIAEELEKLEKVSVYLTKPRPNTSDEERLAMRQAAVQKARELAGRYGENNDELTQLAEEAASATKGRVHISDVVYPGVKITIASRAYKVEDDIQHATFRYRDGELTFVTYEG